VENSFTECFALCDGLEECQGFTWEGIDGAENGVGTGYCNFQRSDTPLTFIQGDLKNRLAVLRVVSPTSSSANISPTATPVSTFAYFVTSTREYTGPETITQPTTVSTIAASGTLPGTVVVEIPISASSTSTFNYYVTSTRAWTGTSPLTQPTVVTTIPPTDGNPGELTSGL
jgi:hypothetical protein